MQGQRNRQESQQISCMTLRNYALRVSVDEALRNQEQSQEEEIEPEPDFEMQLE